MACRILVPPPGIEPGPLAVKAQSPNHWTTREILTECVFEARPHRFIVNDEGWSPHAGISDRRRPTGCPRTCLRTCSLRNQNLTAREMAGDHFFSSSILNLPLFLNLALCKMSFLHNFSIKGHLAHEIYPPHALASTAKQQKLNTTFLVSLKVSWNI